MIEDESPYDPVASLSGADNPAFDFSQISENFENSVGAAAPPIPPRVLRDPWRAEIKKLSLFDFTMILLLYIFPRFLHVCVMPCACKCESTRYTLFQNFDWFYFFFQFVHSLTDKPHIIKWKTWQWLTDWRWLNFAKIGFWIFKDQAHSKICMTGNRAFSFILKLDVLGFKDAYYNLILYKSYKQMKIR